MIALGLIILIQNLFGGRIRGWRFRMNGWVSFRSPVKGIPSLCCGGIVCSPSIACDYWYRCHRRCISPFRSCSIRQCRPRIEERRRSRSIWVISYSCRRPYPCLHTCSQCRWVHRGSNNKRHSRGWRVHMLLGRANSRCRLRRCMRFGGNTNIGESSYLCWPWFNNDYDDLKGVTKICYKNISMLLTVVKNQADDILIELILWAQ